MVPWLSTRGRRHLCVGVRAEERRPAAPERRLEDVTPFADVYLNPDGSMTELLTLAPVRAVIVRQVSGKRSICAWSPEGRWVRPMRPVVDVEIDPAPVADAGGRSWVAEVEFGGEVIALATDTGLAEAEQVEPALEPGPSGPPTSACRLRRRRAGRDRRHCSARPGTSEATQALYDRVEVEPTARKLTMSSRRGAAQVEIIESITVPEGWSLVQNGRSIEIRNADEELQGHWKGGVMFDSDHVEAPELGQVGLRLLGVDDGIATAVVMEEAWLDDLTGTGRLRRPRDRVQRRAAFDTTIWSHQPGTNYASDHGLWAGDFVGDMQALVYFNWTPRPGLEVYPDALAGLG